MKTQPNFHWTGNFTVCEHFLGVLQKRFDYIFLAHGANTSNLLKIKNEDATNILDVKDLTEMFNGKIGAFTNFSQLDLEKVNNVVVIGNGNAAVDMCRILGRPVEQLCHTSIGSKS